MPAVSQAPAASTPPVLRHDWTREEVLALFALPLPELLFRAASVHRQTFDPTQYRMLIFGFAMVAIMVWRPRGFVSTREPSVFLKERKAIASDLVKEGHG